MSSLPQAQAQAQAQARVLVNSATGRTLTLAAPLPRRGWDALPHRSETAWHTADKWSEALAMGDGYGGLWRVHDALYDLEGYLDAHPGGRVFLEKTRGQDISEAFEAHHLRGVSEKLMDKLRVRRLTPAELAEKPPRYDFESYRRIRAAIAGILKRWGNPTGETTTLAGLVYVAVVAQFLAAVVVMAKKRSLKWAVVAGLLLVGPWGVGHNRMHKSRKSWWAWLRYAIDLTPLSSHEQTVTHAISHHLHPNSLLDVEVSVYETAKLYWLPADPHPNNPIFRWFGYFAVLPLALQLELAKRVFRRVLVERDPLKSDVVVPLALFAGIAKLSGGGVREAARLWAAMSASFGAWFLIVGQMVHHAEDVREGSDGRPIQWHEGEPGAQAGWAEQQIIATADHSTWCGQYLSFTLFSGLNHHVMHHLAPTVDISLHRELAAELVEASPEFAKWYAVSRVNDDAFKFGGGPFRLLDLVRGFIAFPVHRAWEVVSSS